MQSSEEMICKTLGEVCVLTQIVYKHQIQQPSTMSIIISTVLLRQDFMQKIVVINFSYLWVRHLGSLHFWYISYHSMHGDLEQGHSIRQDCYKWPCHTGVQACRPVRQEAYCATHWYKIVVLCSIMQGRLEWRVKTENMLTTKEIEIVQTFMKDCLYETLFI